MNRDEILKAIEVLSSKYTNISTTSPIEDAWKDLSKAKRAAIAALQAQLNDGWISVEERLPEPTGMQREFYLVALSNGVVKELAFEFNHYENMLFDVGWHNTAYPVTHWQPLPQPPKQDKQ